MALPPDIVVRVPAPFPALVQGSGPVTLVKANGVWTIGFTITAFASQNPPIANYPTDYALCWDDVAKTFIKVSLTNLAATLGGARTQRLVTASPISVNSTDQILNVNIASGSPTCALPSAASRLGVPLTIIDVGGNFGAHPLTVSAADTIDGASSIVLGTNHQSITLIPANDGTTTGWFL